MTNYPELRQEGKLHKVKLSITIIIIEKPFLCTTTNDELHKLSIPTTNYTINYPQLIQAGTLYKVGQVINIITIQKHIRTNQY